MKKLTLLLVLLMIAALAVSCGETPATTPDDTTPSQSDTAETTPVPVDETVLNIIESGATETKYKVVRAENSEKIVTDAASDLRIAMQNKYGIKSISIATDFEARGADPADRYQFEILVGSTNRDESIAALGSISYNDFIITVSGTRVVILGGNDNATVEAVNYFVENCLTDGALTLGSSDTYHHKAEYGNASATLLGVPLSDYTIVCANANKSIGKIVAGELGEQCGAIMSVVTDSTDPVEHEIIIGNTKRGNVQTYETKDDYSVSVKDGSIYIGGRTAYSIGSGCRDLLDLIKDAKGADVTAASLNINYTLPDRQAYIDNIDLLAMHWDIYMDTPEWMLDFEEKTAAMRDVDGRLMSCLHRNDMVYYPENSIEGIISAIKMGGDMIEIDPRLTKDGVLILIHDATLTRTTNFEEMAGKNGLPESPNVEDWTYAQIQQLNLKEAGGGANAALTPYKIPTLDEAFKVAANRIFIRLDVKGDSTHDRCWDYEKDIWPLIQKYNSYTNVIFTWHAPFNSNNYTFTKQYKKLMKEACGDSAFCFVGMNTNSGNPTSTLTTIKGNDLDYCVRLTNCDFSDISAEEFVAKYKAKLVGLKGKARVYIDAHGGKSAYETHEDWEMLNEAGINLLLVNKGFELCKYISENFGPTQK